MAFWEGVNGLELREFRPGVRSLAELGVGLNMVCMEIGPGLEDAGHEHPFEQCGVVTQGRIEMFVGDERRVLGPMDAYFIPAGARHGWKTLEAPVKVFDVSGKQFQK